MFDLDYVFPTVLSLQMPLQVFSFLHHANVSHFLISFLFRYSPCLEIQISFLHTASKTPFHIYKIDPSSSSSMLSRLSTCVVHRNALLLVPVDEKLIRFDLCHIVSNWNRTSYWSHHQFNSSLSSCSTLSQLSDSALWTKWQHYVNIIHYYHNLKCHWDNINNHEI